MSTNAEVVAWVCFGLGAAILLLAVVIGLMNTPKQAVSAKDASAKVRDAMTKVDALKETAVTGAKKPEADSGAAQQASSQAADLQSVLSDINGIISSLPENLRFVGLLVLIGALLMSVATVQFGGHSIF